MPPTSGWRWSRSWPMWPTLSATGRAGAPTRANLAPARSRISLRRHARLVDYTMGEGTNARAWMQLKVGGDGMLPKGSQVFPRIVGQPALIKPGSANLDQLLRT